MLAATLLKIENELKELTSTSSSCCGSSGALLGETAVTGESSVDDNARFLTETGASASWGRLRDSILSVV